MRFTPAPNMAVLLLAGLLAACSSPADQKTTVETPGLTVQSSDSGSSVVTSNDAESVTVNGNNTTQNRALTGQTVQIIGDDNRATYTGQGNEFYLVGNGNQASVENMKMIQVTGDNNQVKWRGTTPTIHNIGKNNSISEVK